MLLELDLVPYPDAVWYQGQNAVVVNIREYRATRAVAKEKGRLVHSGRVAEKSKMLLV